MLTVALGLFGFFAGFEGDVAGTEADADFLEECVGWSAPGKNPNKVVWNFLVTACDVMIFPAVDF